MAVETFYPVEASEGVKSFDSSKSKSKSFLVTPSASSQVPSTKTITLAESLTLRKKNAVLLAGKYTAGKRRTEIACVSAFATLSAISAYRLCSWYSFHNLWAVICANILAMLLADFLSGVAHWIADTWGTLDTPIIGNTFIRSFREHHLEPVAITRHDFIETNGDNCMLTIPFLALTAFGSIRSNHLYDLFITSFVVLLCFWTMVTNQIHKWSHTRKPPGYVSILQDLGIILSKQDHNKHHQIPFDRNYCITNGWLNPWLTSIGFWRRTEEAITRVTGAIPRQDDKAWTNY